MENWRYRSTHFTLGTRWMQMSGQLHAPTLLFQAKYPTIPIRHTGAYVGPQKCSAYFREQIMLPRRTSIFSYLKKITTLPVETFFFSFPDVNMAYFSVGRGGEGGGGWLNKSVVLFRKVKETSGYIKWGKCLDWTGNYQLFKKGSAHRSFSIS